MKYFTLIFLVLTGLLFADANPFGTYYESKEFTADKKYNGELNCPFKHSSLYKMPPRPSCIKSDDDPEYELACSKCFYYYEPHFKTWSHFHSDPKKFEKPLTKLLLSINIPKQELIEKFNIEFDKDKKREFNIYTNEALFRQELVDGNVKEEYLEYRTLEDYNSHLQKLKTHLNKQNIKDLAFKEDEKEKLKIRFTGNWNEFKVSGILYEFQNNSGKKELVFAISIEPLKT